MRKKYSAMSPEERWEYMQVRGKLDFMFIRPLLYGMVVILVMFGLFLTAGSMSQGLDTTLEIFGPIFKEPKNILQFIGLLLIMPAVYIVTNILTWVIYQKKFGDKAGSKDPKS